MLALAEAQEVELQGNGKLPRPAADGSDVALVGLGITGEVKQVGMGEVAEQAGLQGLQGLAPVLVQELLIGGGAGAENALRLVIERVLAQDQIVHGKLAQIV